MWMMQCGGVSIISLVLGEVMAKACGIADLNFLRSQKNGYHVMPLYHECAGQSVLCCHSREWWFVPSSHQGEIRMYHVGKKGGISRS